MPFITTPLPPNVMKTLQLFSPRPNLADDRRFLVLSFMGSIFLVAFVYYLYVTPGSTAEPEVIEASHPPVETSPLISDPPKSKRRTPAGFYTERKVRLVRETTKELHKLLYCSRCKKPCYLICYCGAKRGTGDAIQGWLQGSEVSGWPGCGKGVFRDGTRGTCQCWQSLVMEGEMEGEMVEPGDMV